MPSTSRKTSRVMALFVSITAALWFTHTASAQTVPTGDSQPRIYAPMVTTAGDTAAPPAVLPTDWLPRVNTYRALAGVPPVGEDEPLSESCQQHARYMAATNQLASDQSPSSPFATLAGQTCAQHSILWLAQGSLATPLDPLAAWMGSTEDRLWLLYPTASAFGFGFSSGVERAAAALDVRSQPNFAADAAYTGWPVRYPGVDQIGVPPDQAPVTLLWPRFGQPPLITGSTMRTAAGAPIEHIASAELPGGHKGIQLVPLASLPQRTTIVVEVSGAYAGAPFSLTWQFVTGEQPQPLPGPGSGAPPAPPAS